MARRKASNPSFKEREIPVAVVDTGVDNAHPSLKGRMWGQSPGGDRAQTFTFGNATYFCDKYGIDASWEASDPDKLNAIMLRYFGRRASRRRRRIPT